MFSSVRTRLVSEYIRQQDLISQLEILLKELNLVPSFVDIEEDEEGLYCLVQLSDKTIVMYLSGYINISATKELFSGEFPRDVEKIKEILRV